MRIGGTPPSSGNHAYTLKIGDVVLLKSDVDAPPMTVGALFGPMKGHVTVQWRDKSGKPHAGTYHENMLKIVPEVKPGS